MLYWMILGGLFLAGGAYVMLNGAKLVKEDNILQDKMTQIYSTDSQKDIPS
ncbi:hypothetical protein FHS16_003906 [Paenibacillus endophyticus]|uniref:Uncharacterized protein n=1 Tax=Paenibacillus endophyticus TaxID=1294268 RepID=A0A7W5C9W4_9BACL|nr:hypothetical protein [Paenibacillus endophyticus]MBB3153831.1 hypothetical protein [Paenibacillus endophyticus]